MSIYKIICIGNTGIGKTSILNRYINGIFNDQTPLTIGVDFFTKIARVNNSELKLQLWDLGGMEKFRQIIKCYFTATNGIMLVYDITNRQSFIDLEYWMKEISDRYNFSDLYDSPSIMLVGCKTDLQRKRVVTETETMEFATKHGIDIVLECSSKSGENIDKIFELIAERIHEIKEKTYKPKEIFEIETDPEPNFSNCCFII